MFLETTPERKIYKELAADHFADPKGLGKYALFLRPSQGDLIPAPQMEPSLLPLRPVPAHHPGGRNLFATRDFYAFFKHLEETGIEATHKGVVVIAMNKLREVMLETPRGTGQCPPHRRRQESLSDQKQEYEHRIKNNKARSPWGAGLLSHWDTDPAGRDGTGLITVEGCLLKKAAYRME